MRSYEGYDPFRREKERWFLRGKLRLLYLSRRLPPLDQIVARGQMIEQDRRRILLRCRIDERTYDLSLYPRSLLSLRRSAPLDQLTVATRAAGAGIDVSPIDGACVVGDITAVFQEDAEDWLRPTSLLTGRAPSSFSKRKLIEAIGRFCRRLHDAGFYHPKFNLDALRVRPASRGARLEFRAHDLEGADLRDVDDDDRFEMLGRAWQHTPLQMRHAMRFLRAYLKEGEDVRGIALLIWHYYGRKIKPEAKPVRRSETAAARQGKFALEAFDVLYLACSDGTGTGPEELTRWYRAGLRDPSLQMIRAKDALSLWQRALVEPAEGAWPIACFVRPKHGSGFVLYRSKA